jgi:hypothetical protein
MDEERRWRAADHEEPNGYAGTAVTEPTKSLGSADLQGPAEKQLETKTTAVEAQKAHPAIPNGGFRGACERASATKLRPILNVD